jgi:hypothetical protein
VKDEEEEKENVVYVSVCVDVAVVLEVRFEAGKRPVYMENVGTVLEIEYDHGMMSSATRPRTKCMGLGDSAMLLHLPWKQFNTPILHSQSVRFSGNSTEHIHARLPWRSLPAFVRVG